MTSWRWSTRWPQRVSRCRHSPGGCVLNTVQRSTAPGACSTRCRPCTASSGSTPYRRPHACIRYADVTAMLDQKREADVAHVEIEGVSKRFGATAALSDVSMSVEAGRVHGLLGE